MTAPTTTEVAAEVDQVFYDGFIQGLRHLPEEGGPLAFGLGRYVTAATERVERLAAVVRNADLVASAAPGTAIEDSALVDALSKVVGVDDPHMLEIPGLGEDVPLEDVPWTPALFRETFENLTAKPFDSLIKEVREAAAAELAALERVLRGDGPAAEGSLTAIGKKYGLSVLALQRHKAHKMAEEDACPTTAPRAVPGPEDAGQRDNDIDTRIRALQAGGASVRAIASAVGLSKSAVSRRLSAAAGTRG